MNFIKKNIHGVKASINRAAISRIMYADNIILFSKATRKDASTLSPLSLCVLKILSI